MKRLVTITVGKTHSGKSTFARALEEQLPNALVIDQDNHAAFINTHYRALLPPTGPNTTKYAVTEATVNCAVHPTDLDLILCNANRSRSNRLTLLTKFRNLGFTSVLVHFDISDTVLAARVADTERSTIIFRTASSFKEVLDRQRAESVKEDNAAPLKSEADHYFSVVSSEEVSRTVRDVVSLKRSL